MVYPFRFAVVSDPHVTLPPTLRDTPNRFHLVEVSIPVLEHILQSLETQALDFLLLPGDLTQHGERKNHQWLADRLKALPFPTYVVPGNHDIITRDGCDRTLGLREFTQLYSPFGYGSSAQPYYCRELLPEVHLIGLNSIAFDEAGQQLPVGYLDDEQLQWLSAQLQTLRGWVMVMVHHNVLEHLPGQAKHPLGQRYILQNRKALLAILEQAVSLLFTGHLHVQDIAQTGSLWEITTGSLVSYPHPYRIITMTPQATGHMQLKVETFRVPSVEGWPDLQASSLQWMCDRSTPFIVKLLSSPPFGLPPAQAELLAPDLKDFWASIAAGDANFEYPQLPTAVNRHLRAFGAVDRQGAYRPIDNDTTLLLSAPAQ